jgi:phosphoglycolate phosphatase
MPIDSARLQVLLFDMDGVLVDSRDAIARSINHALIEHGLDARPEPELHARVGEPLPAALAALLAAQGTGDDLVPSCMRSYRKRYGEAGLVETRVFAGVPEMLAALSARRLGVATTRPPEYARPILEALGLADAFEVIVGSPVSSTQSESKTVTVARALEAMGFPTGNGQDAPPAAMIGDRHFDMQAGRAHGLLSVGVTWGIGDVKELREAGAHHLAEDPGDLVRLLA